VQQDHDIPDETEMVHTGGSTMKFPIDGVTVSMKPGEFRKFNSRYCLPRRIREGGDPVDGVIPMLTGGNVVPISHERAQSFVAQRKLAEEAAAKR
jgi:hypothetical protein